MLLPHYIDQMSHIHNYLENHMQCHYHYNPNIQVFHTNQDFLHSIHSLLPLQNHSYNSLHHSNSSNLLHNTNHLVNCTDHPAKHIHFQQYNCHYPYGSSILLLHTSQNRFAIRNLLLKQYIH